MRRFYTFLLFISFNLSAQVPGYKAIVNNGSPGGYYFVAPLVFSGVHHAYSIILDSTGSVVYYKKFPNSVIYGFELQPNGLVSYYSTGQSRFLMEDSTLRVIDNVSAKNGYKNDAHELQILPDGHHLMLAQEYVTMDLRSYLYFNHNGSPGSATALVICAIIQELDENKNVVFEWHARDHLSFDSVDDFYLSTPANVDWTHANALALDNDGNILMSSRHLNEITKINRQDGSVMWRLGGKYNQFTFIGDTVPFYGQHAIRSLSNGHVTLYDDGNHFTPHGARALEYQLDTVTMTAELVWSYTYDSAMYSSALGNVQRLDDSNTLINYGQVTGKNVCFNVVDSNGAELFRLTFDNMESSYRAFHYPQLPWSIQRPQISCFNSGDTLYLDAGSGYNHYQWSNDDTTQTIAVLSPDTFHVFVSYGQGGFVSSEKTIVTDVHSFCEITSVSTAIPGNNLKVFPNPAHETISIYSGSSQYHGSPLIKDLSGRIISIPEGEKGLNGNTVNYDISSLATGFYILTVDGQSFKFIKD